MNKSVEFNGVYFHIKMAGYFEDAYLDIQQLRQEMFSRPDFTEPYRSLWDWRGFDSQSGGLLLEDLRDTSDIDSIRPERIGYLVEDNFMHGLVRQYISIDVDQVSSSLLLTRSFADVDAFLRG